LADWYTIAGVPPYDGRYGLDIDEQPLTTREWRWVKRHGGYLPLTLDRAALTDPDLIIVQAAIAIHRAGKVDTADVPGLIERFEDVDPFAAITFEPGSLDEAGDADGPPASSSDAKPSSSGANSPNGSESSDSPLSPTGLPRSDTSASAPPISVS
jgi:hypothetical protein